MSQPYLSIVIPVLNEADNLKQLFDRLFTILGQTGKSFEIVVVDDGSTDQTLQVALAIQKERGKITVIELSRNFGKEAALTAGLQHSAGAGVITIDADLQDPPELILEMIAKWEAGSEVVTAVRSDRDSDTFRKRQTAKAFYWLMERISNIRVQPNAGDYRLFDRKAVNALLSLPERSRFNKGLFAWIGFKTAVVYHAREARNAGSSQFNFNKLFALAVDGITSFSIAPLRIFSWLGLLTALFAFAYGAYIFLRTLLYGADLPGYASIFVVIMFFGGLNLIGIGLLGEYIGRIFIETKQRPLYLISHVYAGREPSTEYATPEHTRKLTTNARQMNK